MNKGETHGFVIMSTVACYLITVSLNADLTRTRVRCKGALLSMPSMCTMHVKDSFGLIRNFAKVPRFFQKWI